MIIGIHGFKGSGKNTVATYIERQYRFTQIGYADKVKESICALFDVTRDEIEQWKNDPRMAIELCEYAHESDVGIDPNFAFVKSFTFRQFIQRFATEAARDIYGNDFWVNFVIEAYRGSFPQNFVVNDVRFENELKTILGEGGKNFHLIRPDVISDGHASEIAFPELCQGIVMNDGSFDDLFAAIDIKMLALGFRK